MEMNTGRGDENLKNKDISELKVFFSELGEPRYRAEQAFLRIHKYLAQSIDELSEFSLELRKRLKQISCLSPLNMRQNDSGSDGTEKAVFELENKEKIIEAVWIVSSNRDTICVSSQVGCSLNCSFCATGTLPFRGNLKTHEILDQVYSFVRHRKKSMSNIVFMGMGEPFYNYENVIRAAKILSHPKGLGIGVRHITISTAGVVPAIERFTREKQPFNLAVSLNHTNETGRTNIMDINRTHSLAGLLKALRRYTKEMNRRITLEYVVIPQINMKDENIRELVKIARSVRCHINLIPLNTELNGWRRPETDEVLHFQSKLRAHGLTVFNRGSTGREINGACGMLALEGVRGLG